MTRVAPAAPGRVLCETLAVACEAGSYSGSAHVSDTDTLLKGKASMSRPHRSLALALAALLSAPIVATAQPAPAVQHFPLYKPIPEPALTACKTPDVLIRVNTLAADGQEVEAMKMFEQAVGEGQCANGSAVVTYTRQVHRIDRGTGDVWTVYEGKSGGVTIYIPMRGFLHTEVTA
jgi:hypothetical protein